MNKLDRCHYYGSSRSIAIISLLLLLLLDLACSSMVMATTTDPHHQQHYPIQLIRRQNTPTSSSNSTTTPPTANATNTVTGTCFSLINSTQCPEFKDAEIPTGHVVNGVAVHNLGEFDKAIHNLVNSNTTNTIVNKWADNCTAWNSMHQPRYMLTMACAMVVFSPETKKCAQLPASSIQGIARNDNTPNSNSWNNDPLPVCESTCAEYTKGWLDIIKDPTICPNQDGWFPKKQRDLTLLCASNSFNGQSSVCISGIANEKDTCGFALPINTENACEYCFNNPNEQCCQRMKNEKVNACTSVKAANVSNQHEKTNITLIICACAAAILIVAGFILWRIRYGKQQGNNQNKPPNQIYRALFSYLPNLEDEMLLEVGDIIEVDQIFSDDWAHGCNYTTGEIGMLPMSFLSLASPGQQYQRAPWPTVDKKPVQGVPYKEESYTTTTDMMTDMSGSQGNEPRRHSSRLPSYIDKTDPSNEQRHTWHMLPAMMEKEQEHQQQHQHLAPQRVTISQHPSLATIAGSQRSVSRRTTSLRRSHLNLTDLSSIAPSSQFNYRSSMQSHHPYPHSSLSHLQTDSDILRSSQMFNDNAVHPTPNSNSNNTDSVVIIPSITRQSSTSIWDPQRSPPRPPSQPHPPPRTMPHDE